MTQTIKLHGSYEIDKMRAAGQAAAELLAYLGEAVKPGISTKHLDDLAHKWASERGLRNAPLGYLGTGTVPFPGSICTSVNNTVCHGIPSESQILQDGDIINIDVTPIVSGYHGDTSKTFAVGNITPEVQKLIAATEECLRLGIAAAGPGKYTGDIGAAIQKHATYAGFSVVRELTGHGVGRKFHTSPTILHFGMPFTGIKLEPGMIFTIEPMINAGKRDIIQDMEDSWTIRTKDGSLSAQAEHTILITPTGVEILTKPENK